MFGSTKELEEQVAQLQKEMMAVREALSGALERIQELEVPKRPRTHFSGRPPESK